MRLWYRLLVNPCRLLSVVLFGLTAFGRKNVPNKGPFLLVSNHQSYLDLFLITSCLGCEITYLVREELFKSFIFRILTFPFRRISIRRAEADLSAIKETVKTLKSGMPVMMFPEGTRTKDGKLSHFRGGFTLIAQEANVPIVPTLVMGAYQILPRGRFLPCPGRVRVFFLESVSPDSDRRKLLDQIVSSLKETWRQNLPRTREPQL